MCVCVCVCVCERERERGVGVRALVDPSFSTFLVHSTLLVRNPLQSFDEF